MQKTRLKVLVEKATELGVTALQPLSSEVGVVFNT